MIKKNPMATSLEGDGHKAPNKKENDFDHIAQQLNNKF